MAPKDSTQTEDSLNDRSLAHRQVRIPWQRGGVIPSDLARGDSRTCLPTYLCTQRSLSLLVRNGISALMAGARMPSRLLLSRAPNCLPSTAPLLASCKHNGDMNGTCGWHNSGKVSERWPVLLLPPHQHLLWKRYNVGRSSAKPHAQPLTSTM